MLNKVLPLAIATFVVTAGAMIFLATSSWLGAVLFGITAKDSLTTYTPPTLILSIALTLTGAFFQHKLAPNKGRRYKQAPLPARLSPAIPQQFSHVLVPGGKEAENETTIDQPATHSSAATSANPAQSETPQTHYEDMSATATPYSWSTRKWGARHDYPILSGPPDQVEPNITSLSFSCQECKRTIILPWGKTNTLTGLDQLQVDCPHCHRQYPLDYARAERKTLYITFKGIIKEKGAKKPASTPLPTSSRTIQTPSIEITQGPAEPNQISEPAIPQPAQTITAPTPITVSAPESSPDKISLASHLEAPLGEAAKAIRTSSKAIVDTIVTSRFLQSFVARIQPGTQGPTLDTRSSDPSQFNHILVPGGKEGESITQVIPTTASDWAPAMGANAYSSHGSFEDMSSPDNGTDSIEQIVPLPTATPSLAPPDRLAIHIESFQFNCQDCKAPVPLAWEKVVAGPSTTPFPVDCPSCKHQIEFNYDKASRKTLILRLRPYVEEIVAPAPPAPIQEPVSPIENLQIVEQSKITDLAVTVPKRYSPGLAYDRAILEKG